MGLIQIHHELSINLQIIRTLKIGTYLNHKSLLYVLSMNQQKRYCEMSVIEDLSKAFS